MFDSRDRERSDRLARARRRGRLLLLDPGSSTLTGAIAWWDSPEGAGGDESPTRLAGVASIPSRGLGAHGVTDAREFRRALRELVDKIEGSAKRGAVDEVLIGVQSRSLLCHHARGDAKVSGGRVAERDMVRALGRCARPPGVEDRAVLHALPVQYSIDDKDGILDPRDLAGRSLIADMLWNTVARPALEELAGSAEACGLKPAGFAAAPYAAGFACKEASPKGTGYACVDLGASATGVSLFLRGQCIHCSTLPLGGGRIVSRIANVLGLGLDEAELVRCGGRDGDAAGEVAEIVDAGLHGIFERIRDLLQEQEFYDMPGRAVLLGGGGARDRRAHEIASGILDCPVLRTRVRSVWWPSERANDPAYVGLQGLARLAREAPPDLRDLERSAAASVTGLVRRTAHWISDNW